MDNSEDKDVMGHVMPNLIYVSREKRKSTIHHFKAGALNALVSAVLLIKHILILFAELNLRFEIAIYAITYLSIMFS